MTNKTIKRYIWLLNTLLENKPLTQDEINTLWMRYEEGDGNPLSKRTFHDHCRAIKDLFGAEICCNPSNNYRYHIENKEKINNDRTLKWLYRSMSLADKIDVCRARERIMPEEFPKGSIFLQPVLNALNNNKVLLLDYQAHGGKNERFHVKPYILKAYRQRWYILGEIAERDGLRHLALDRILHLETTEDSFSMPRGFDAQEFYKDSVGIYVNPSLKPQKVVIRAYGKTVDYLRDLPLHRSQEEGRSNLEQQFCEFHYRVCLTPELTSRLLSMGENVEVLEPQELREEIKRRLTLCLTKYK